MRSRPRRASSENPASPRMVGLGGHWAGSIGSRRADASNRGYPGGLRSPGVTIGGEAGGHRFRRPEPIGLLRNGGSVAGWENWKERASGEWIRTFAIITTDANELVADTYASRP